MSKDGLRPLAGQKAIVTGGSSGIGAAVAAVFAAAGAAVGINYHSNGAAAEQIVEDIGAKGGEALALKADVAREDQVADMFSRFTDRFGQLDILVANSGIQLDAPTVAMTLDQWQRVLDVNLTGQFLCAREAARLFKMQEGRDRDSRAASKIICMSSVHEVIPWAGHLNYAAAKGGIMMMMKTLAQELAPNGTRVNGIAPGAIRTAINRDAWETPEAEKKLLELIPYGRVGEPEDVARAAVWLASDASDYVVGTTLYVDGGMTLYPAFRENG
ncbi:glucose 1-dehydrogenase [Devosia sp. Naph2]|uniref:glucose 1-dehydrogenase n=1 Tax=Devosia polycyclovorans TaxID=3345148 RepID=UPI0035CEEC4A